VAVPDDANCTAGQERERGVFKPGVPGHPGRDANATFRPEHMRIKEGLLALLGAVSFTMLSGTRSPMHGARPNKRSLPAAMPPG